MYICLVCARVCPNSLPSQVLSHMNTSILLLPLPLHVTECPTMHLMWEKSRFSRRGAVQKASFNTQGKEGLKNLLPFPAMQMLLFEM